MTARIGRPLLPPNERTHKIAISLPRWLVESLQAEAAKDRISVSRVIRRDLERSRWHEEPGP